MAGRRLHVLRKSDYEHELQIAKQTIHAVWSETAQLVAIKRLYDSGLMYSQAEFCIRGSQPQKPRLIKYAKTTPISNISKDEIAD
jgi:Na+-transporting NADH:ubiquinone oxidoreductase subunit NqrA